MSLCVVKLSQWYPKKAVKYALSSEEEQLAHYMTVKQCIKQSTCCHCNKKPRYERAWGAHSIPWGEGWDAVWCSRQCVDSDSNFTWKRKKK